MIPRNDKLLSKKPIIKNQTQPTFKTEAFSDVSTPATGNLFYVDSQFGNDSPGSARPNQPGRPYKTIGAAVNVLRSIGTPQTIYVRPGTYNETQNLLTDAW